MLNLSKLEKVRRLEGGRIEARCPACAAAGRDKGGVHLRIAPAGGFCCVVNPGDAGRWHRKEIFRLAGLLEKRERKMPEITWRMKR